MYNVFSYITADLCSLDHLFQHIYRELEAAMLWVLGQSEQPPHSLSLVLGPILIWITNNLLLTHRQARRLDEDEEAFWWDWVWGCYIRGWACFWLLSSVKFKYKYMVCSILKLDEVIAAPDKPGGTLEIILTMQDILIFALYFILFS